MFEVDLESIIKDFKRSNKVFVYGTLKSGYYNNYLLDGCVFLGNYITDSKFDLYNISRVGGFPIMVPGEHSIYGEIYELKTIDDMMNLDRLEGHPHNYKRSIIGIDSDGSEIWGYVYQNCGYNKFSKATIYEVAPNTLMWY